MRGKVSFTLAADVCRRITPAYAGKRTEGSFSYETSRDHPRLCGEKFDQMCFAGRDPGSPPPMRGKVTVNPDGSVTHGITPAYAGKRPFAVNKTPAGGDHPRLCGEKFSESLQTLVMIGSPPPMRGKACDKRKFRRGIRITPAYAGKSGIITVEVSYMQDHPRLCGEKTVKGFRDPAEKGSPPPMRGKDATIEFRVPVLRITPAYAGKRCSHCHKTLDKWDHPRLCGEKSACTRANLPWTGSPPPMRGKAV